jgi:crotonobetainyl-CoA:carnitine CoA-transferase CaiB-like acyl-CoA transferase
LSVLSGIRVVDFTTAMAGPTCSMLLGDFGADVVKVEPPGGELGRKWGKNRFGPRGEFSGLFVALNRNKSSLAVDMKSREGGEAVRKLLAKADVVIEGFKPGVADRLGIGYANVVEYNPSVVYASISGFGQNGPMRELPGMDMLMQAYVGHMSITGEPDRPSIRTGPSPIDLLTGTNTAFGIVLALLERKNSGKGQYVETSLYDTAVEMVSHFLADFTGSGDVPVKTGAHFAFSSPYGVFHASDREIYIGASHQKSYEGLCESIERPDLITNPLFANNALRIQHREHLHKELFPIFASRTAQEWFDLCIKLSIPASLVEGIDEVINQPQIQAREMLVDSGIDNVRSGGIPIKMHGTPGSIRRRPPGVGEDNDRLLAELANLE